MQCLITGAAGFIGSHLCERLLAAGARVIGIDCFTDFYPRQIKERNLATVRTHSAFTLHEANLLEAPLPSLLRNVEVVFHLAAQAGVRTSWGREFATYTNCNILATQRLLEACRDRRLRRVVVASSSSVYGDCDELPLREESPLRPVSPYGITKLATEHLASLYASKFTVPVVSLRYFTVYGPRQRPDMAFSRFLQRLARDEPLEIYGDGTQTRDFTYIDDIIDATVRSAERGLAGAVYNIGGGSRVSLNEAIETLTAQLKKAPHLLHQAPQVGDMRHTFADITKAQAELQYTPRVPLAEGLRRQVEWFLLSSGG
ncbi:MAG: NAD-dependent epimerase/dehydratase family protein [Candidatus Tectomicrobia bacterium]|nr:NAD-dependent epimerase/dehydratase family protein [Candidatus Tectomicrobia bacterium]